MWIIIETDQLNRNPSIYEALMYDNAGKNQLKIVYLICVLDITGHTSWGK